MCFEFVCVDTQTKQRASHFVSQFFCTVEVAILTCRIRYLKKEGRKDAGENTLLLGRDLSVSSMASRSEVHERRDKVTPRKVIREGRSQHTYQKCRLFKWT